MYTHGHKCGLADVSPVIRWFGTKSTKAFSHWILEASVKPFTQSQRLYTAICIPNIHQNSVENYRIKSANFQVILNKTAIKAICYAYSPAYSSYVDFNSVATFVMTAERD